MSYRLVEEYGNYKQPVASIVEINGNKTLYRNITARHYFRKGDYCALFIDDAVVSWLRENDPSVTLVTFDDGTKALTTTMEKYRNAKPRNMAGRKQRGVTITCFTTTDSMRCQRPLEERVIRCET